MTRAGDDHNLMTMARTSTNQLAAGKFKATCLGVLDEVEATGKSFIITKRGRPVARIVPIEAPRGLAGSVLREGDLVGPIDVDWDADR